MVTVKSMLSSLGQTQDGRIVLTKTAKVIKGESCGKGLA